MNGILSAAPSLMETPVVRIIIIQNNMHIMFAECLIKTVFVKTISSSSGIKMFVCLSSFNSFIFFLKF